MSPAGERAEPARRSLVVVTCEHAGARVPTWLAPHFGSAAAGRALAGHRGSDLGVEPVFLSLARGADLAASNHTTRLAVDLNRSLHHRHLFSEFTRPLPARSRQRLIDSVYLPYRQRVESAIGDAVATGRHVLHLSVHSFTPELTPDRPRHVEIGVLYDPSRERERAFASAWLNALRTADPPSQPWRLRRNAPYRGTADGFVAHLRRRFPHARYTGLELEVNQRLLTPHPTPGLADLVTSTFQSTLGSCR